MGEPPKREIPPLEKTGKPATPALFSSPRSFPLLLCAAAVVLVGGGLFYTATRPTPIRLSDVTRSPLGFDVGNLEDQEADDEEEGLIAITGPSSSMSSTSSSHSSISQPSQPPQAAPVTPHYRTPPRDRSRAMQPDEPFEDPQIRDEDFNEPKTLQAQGPQFYERVHMLEQEIHELRSVLTQRERMIGQLSKELAESRSRAAIVAVETAPLPVLEAMPAPTARTHVVKKGETLSEIAQHHYGTRTAWTKIYRANAERLSDKNRLPVGVVLTIPE